MPAIVQPQRWRAGKSFEKEARYQRVAFYWLITRKFGGNTHFLQRAAEYPTAQQLDGSSRWHAYLEGPAGRCLESGVLRSAWHSVWVQAKVLLQSN